MRALAALLGLTLLLGGCAADVRAARAAHVAEMNHYIGMSEAELVQARGVPTAVAETGGARVLTYVASHIDLWEPLPAFGFGRFGDYGGMFPAQVTEWRCVTRFELSRDRVIAWTEHGNNC